MLIVDHLIFIDLHATSRTKTALPYHGGNELGSASLIRNWLCDKGASVRMTTMCLDLEQEDEDGHSLVEKHPSVHVEIADGPLVDVPTFVDVILNLKDIDGGTFTVILKNIKYVPGITQGTSSVSHLHKMTTQLR
jgi:hypothetical protein